MKFRPTPCRTPAADQCRAGFTLAEVLAALLFMAIVIPVAVQGLRTASLAGEVAQRKSIAARVAERVLAESVVTTNWNASTQSGSVMENGLEFRWTLQNAAWLEDPLRLLSVEVMYAVQNRDYSVRLSTLVDGSLQ